MPYSNSMCVMGDKPCLIPAMATNNSDRFVSAMQLKRGVRHGEQTWVAALKLNEALDSTPVPAVVKKILRQFADVMPEQLPKELPPRRGVDHAIELVPGAKPPARAPYRMAIPELNELRKRLTELLEAGLLEPLPVPKRPWESVSLDFITGLPKVGDIGTILNIVDRFSKYATFIAAPKYVSAEETAQLLFKHIVKYWGVPKSIVSDRDTRFVGNFWTELFKLLGSQLNTSSSYHPETDGQTERFNCMLEEYLRHFVNANQRNWVQLLDVAQLCFNSQKSSSTGKSAFEIVNGQQPLLPHTVDGPYEGKSPRAYQFAKEWKRNHDITRAYLEKAASKMKKWADEKRRPLEFKAGDQVLVKLNPEQRKFMRGRDRRLVRKYEGPVTILKRIGKCAYKIDAPSWLKVHPVFHVSYLKPYYPDKEDPTRNEQKRQTITAKAGKRSIESILADRVKMVSKKQQRQYLVKWKGLGDEEISWEREADLSAFQDEIEAYWAKSSRASTVQVGETVKVRPSKGQHLDATHICALWRAKAMPKKLLVQVQDMP
ncbi:hypothetical protein CsSME_00045408 [Camellia sinensis var. sinensis]